MLKVLVMQLLPYAEVVSVIDKYNVPKTSNTGPAARANSTTCDLWKEIFTIFLVKYSRLGKTDAISRKRKGRASS